MPTKSHFFVYNPLFGILSNKFEDNFGFLIEPSGLIPHEGLNIIEKQRLLVLNQYGGKILTANEVVEILHHDNKVPLWINMTIYQSNNNITIVHLFCSRRLRNELELYSDAVKYPPFNCLVPRPPHTDNKREDGKFDINWKKEFDIQKHSRSIKPKILKSISNWLGLYKS